ncbi:RNA polymerase sigma factor, sigma-70 family [Gemmatirosa kalamazoonensis]|uniref:RNA polymerase sigma factor, sigma-70 family n=2 Tax=Gemmatirosa kalamazoonensis TaxID=861299 RepID=W0RCL4_9BACT|nr:RNA polymerase sigma factor, sigma-70 family [Gemmatirosa kalamazoonensis]
MPPGSASLRVVRGADRLHAGSATPAGELVALSRDGDPIAFRLLVERYYPRMLRFAANMGLGKEDAEEAVQDALVRAHGALDRFDASAPFEPWLFRILANCCRTAHGRGRWWRRLRVEAPIERTPMRDTTGDAEWSEEIRRALDTLPREQREAFLLRHVEGMDYEAMMTVTGAGLSALKMRVKRACDALRAQLGALA